jgi:hypothetical protein
MGQIRNLTKLRQKLRRDRHSLHRQISQPLLLLNHRLVFYHRAQGLGQDGRSRRRPLAEVTVRPQRQRAQPRYLAQ